jgi:hypothetical protein
LAEEDVVLAAPLAANVLFSPAAAASMSGATASCPFDCVCGRLLNGTAAQRASTASCCCRGNGSCSGFAAARLARGVRLARELRVLYAAGALEAASFCHGELGPPASVGGQPMRSSKSISAPSRGSRFTSEAGRGLAVP